MKATDILMEEHEIIIQAIEALEAGASQLQAGTPVRPGFFSDAAAFFKEFGDGCHHRKEEGSLFPSMEAYGIPARGGPIGVMLAEHEQGRAYIHGLREAAAKMEEGDEQPHSDVLTNARSYARLLRQHIQKENSVLFPLADRVIPISQQDELLAAFEKVEEEETGAGVHEKYLALAHALRSEVGLIAVA